MHYKTMTEEDVMAFKKAIGDSHVSTLNEDKKNYGHDYTEDLQFDPEVVLKPGGPEEISQILRYCQDNAIPITPRGGGTGLSGGALPVFGGILLSTERLNRIIEIDEANFQATVEPGVVNEVLQEALETKGLFYPPDPASKGSCYIGGNLAENAGGPKAIKYGVTEDYVLNLEVVLPTGEVIWTGANTLKNATGYNLTQLIVGSEGTLGVITKIVLKLTTKPKESLLMLAAFNSADQACKAVNGILRAGIVPSALEFMERNAIDWVMALMNIHFPVAEEVQAHLLIEVDGNDQEILFKESEQIYEVLETFETGEVYFADNENDKEKLWKLRRNVAEAVHANSVYKEEDTVVPRSCLPALLKGVKSVGERYGFQTVCYGHAGDGNLHVNIVKGDLDEHAWDVTVKEGIREIFRLCTDMGGTISGEHGIGYVQKNYMDIPFNEVQLNLMRAIKHVFDPKDILNPGKIFKD